jgi:hypothetical protein
MFSNVVTIWAKTDIKLLYQDDGRNSYIAMVTPLTFTFYNIKTAVIPTFQQGNKVIKNKIIN